jgi:hypothetical protein
MPRGKSLNPLPPRNTSCGRCGSCRNCKTRESKRLWRQRNYVPVVLGVDERKVDLEPAFDDLTMRLIEKFFREGWDA